MAEPAFTSTLIDFGLTLGLGALIGLERERHRQDKLVLAGVRTYPLVSLGGLLAAILSQELQIPTLVSVGAFVTGGFALLMYWVRQAHGTVGLTSPIALFATYFVGVLVGVDRHFSAVVTGLAIALLLFTKERLHRLAEVMTPQEMEGALYFLVLTFILYPVSPAEPIDPWNLFRLRALLLVVILVSLLSFISFLVVRRWGPQFGLPFSGFLGGLVNSEAATASLTDLHERKAGFRDVAYVGILFATATMFLRNLAIAAIAHPNPEALDFRLAGAMLVPMMWASLIFLVWALFYIKNVRTPKDATLPLESPFAFKPAFLFAFWFTLVGIAAYLLTQNLGDKFVYAAALGGLASAGAVVASMAALVATGHIAVEPAAVTAILASLLSATNKILIARIGTRGLARRLVLPTLLASVAGCGFLVWTLSP